MGMTLDEAISNLEQIKAGFDYCYGTNKMVKVVVYGDDIQTFDFVIDTMRKYQKIKDILNNASYTKNDTVYSYTYDEDSRVKHIRKVVEDGNNNQHN